MATETEIAIAIPNFCSGFANLISDSFIKSFSSSGENVVLTPIESKDIPQTAGPDAVTLGLSSAEMSLTLRMLFAEDFAAAMSQRIHKQVPAEKMRRMAIDLVKEIVNVTSGFIARRLLPKISMNASVPISETVGQIKLDLSDDDAVYTMVWSSGSAPAKFVCIAEMRVKNAGPLRNVDFDAAMEQEPEGIELL